MNKVYLFKDITTGHAFDEFLLKVEKLDIEYEASSFFGFVTIPKKEDQLAFEIAFGKDVEEHDLQNL